MEIIDYPQPIEKKSLDLSPERVKLRAKQFIVPRGKRVMQHPTFRAVTLLAAFLLILAGPALLNAQAVSGELTGTVYDATGASIPNATVTATNTETGVQTAAETTSTGQYRLRNLPAGTYNVNVVAAGFTASQVKNIAVNLNVTSTENFTLQVGESKTVLEVSAAAVAIDT